MPSARLLDQPEFSLGSIGSRQVLEDLRLMIDFCYLKCMIEKLKVKHEREMFVCTDLVEVFSTALRWNPERTDLFFDTKTMRAFEAFYAFEKALGKDPRETFLRPLLEAMEKFLKRVAACEPRPLEVPENLKESILKDLEQLIMLANHWGFALPAK